MTLQNIFALFIICLGLFITYHLALLPRYIMKLVAFLYKRNRWFPKSLAEVRAKQIDKLQKTNRQLDLYNIEMENNKIGVFDPFKNIN